MMTIGADSSLVADKAHRMAKVCFQDGSILAAAVTPKNRIPAEEPLISSLTLAAAIKIKAPAEAGFSDGKISLQLRTHMGEWTLGLASTFNSNPLFLH